MHGNSMKELIRKANLVDTQRVVHHMCCLENVIIMSDEGAPFTADLIIKNSIKMSSSTRTSKHTMNARIMKTVNFDVINVSNVVCIKRHSVASAGVMPTTFPCTVPAQPSSIFVQVPDMTMLFRISFCIYNANY